MREELESLTDSYGSNRGPEQVFASYSVADRGRPEESTTPSNEVDTANHADFPIINACQIKLLLPVVEGLARARVGLPGCNRWISCADIFFCARWLVNLASIVANVGIWGLCEIA